MTTGTRPKPAPVPTAHPLLFGVVEWAPASAPPALGGGLGNEVLPPPPVLPMPGAGPVGEPASPLLSRAGGAKTEVQLLGGGAPASRTAGSGAPEPGDGSLATGVL